MSILDKFIRDSNKPSVIKNPFEKDSVTDISIRFTKRLFSEQRYWYAKIEFTKGNTKGEQRTPDCDDFDEVMTELKKILNSLP